ncbi:hypothetical protein ACFYWS_16000 [Streptomyces sp. NPDC002795]|uniref:hypothetical protein n=1 Tax=Streptomyces sp. NPDC002795 TaxID=3364665 RepID=UPI0036D17B42
MPLWTRKRRRPPHLELPGLQHVSVLEHDLSGIEPEPGTPAACAAALARPVEQDVCPHEDVMDLMDVTQFGQTRPAGMCTHCGADVVETGEGLWDRS